MSSILPLEEQRRIQRAVFFELLPGQTSVELDQIQIVRLHPPQALLHTGSDVVGSVDVLSTHRRPGNATAFGGEEVLAAPMSDEASNQLFALSIVDGRVDKVDTGIQNRVEHLLCRRVGNGWSRRCSAQFHRTVA